jgi:hypothetical protein
MKLLLMNFILLLAWGNGILMAQPEDKIYIPAYISYVEPIGPGVTIDEKKGITNWTSDQIEIQCYFYLANTGELNLEMQADYETESILKATFNEKTMEVKTAKNSQQKNLNIGNFNISHAGYYCLQLKGISRKGKQFPSISAFVISGAAAKGAHFNTQPRRNAASVHLKYILPDTSKVEWFYNEVTVPQGFEPIATFYMANGFKRGYFGIQVNSETERRVIFSVWDSGSEAIDRQKVQDDNRVVLLKKGTDVVANDFGNEGTGGHSHWIYPWKTGQTYRFLLHAQPKDKFTTYTGYFFLNDKKEWKLIASFRAPKDGDYLNNLYSFVENFWGDNGQKMRKALYNNQWIVTANGTWKELNSCMFTHDPTGKIERKDYGAGVENGSFYLFNGGFVPGTAQYGNTFTRPFHPEKPAIMLPNE